MLKFILRRCLEAIPTLFILITISFFMMRLAPGSPFTGERTLPPEVMANIEAKYHLKRPYHDAVLQLSEAAGAWRFWSLF
ncbi:Oligopeptide transport system permease protein OppB (TC 3.A.1.5.1) [Klebsiella pneumoniae IS39]|nr:Oligopeptide transport system permease protein OppB (TC 3.A.1.5.1) [Klebsiella pneumoniae IS39]VTN55037.1 Oligopeptide transport system permease OppB [Klebsiella pneumoniae]